MNERESGELDRIIGQAAGGARASTRPDAPFIIAIAGGSASGKTTLTHQLAQNLGPDQVTIFQQDEFQLGWNFEEQSTSPYRWDDPRNYTPIEVRNALMALRSGKPVEIPRFDLAQNIRVGSRRVKPAKFVIFEGLYALSEDFPRHVDHSIYVSAPLYARFLRRVFRFMQDVDPAKGAVTVRHMANFVVDAHRTFVRPQHDVADQVFRAPYDFVAETVKKFALENVSLKRPDGTIRQVIDLPSEVALSVYHPDEQGCSFSIEWRKNVIFNCVVDTPVAEKILTLDWFSL